MLRRLLQILWGPPPTVQPRIRDILERLDALEGESNGLRKRVKQLEGQISGGKRRHSDQEEPQDAPGDEISADPDQLSLQEPSPYSTAHLSRRFRGF